MRHDLSGSIDRSHDFRTMIYSTEQKNLTATPSRANREPLTKLLKRRTEVEKRFAKLGHTDRHGPFYRKFEHAVTRPLLKLGLKTMGIYSRGQENALTPVVRNIELHFANLPSAFEGFRILHLSDFHIDRNPRLAHVLAQTLNGLTADLCVLTGDYRFEDHGPCEPLYPLMREILSSISASYGTFGILGNHDTSEIALRLEQMGLSMLVNEAVVIEKDGQSLWLIGVDDPFDYQCHELGKARASIPPGSFEVLLAHAPEIYREAAQAGVSLYLSGHTHAGQIRIPGIGAVRQNATCPRAYTFGHWQHGDMQGYTSAGVGCSSLPVRFNCPPEIVVLELHASQPDLKDYGEV